MYASGANVRDSSFMVVDYKLFKICNHYAQQFVFICPRLVERPRYFSEKFKPSLECLAQLASHHMYKKSFNHLF